MRISYDSKVATHQHFIGCAQQQICEEHMTVDIHEQCSSPALRHPCPSPKCQGTVNALRKATFQEDSYPVRFLPAFDVHLYGSFKTPCILSPPSQPCLAASSPASTSPATWRIQTKHRTTAQAPVVRLSLKPSEDFPVLSA